MKQKEAILDSAFCFWSQEDEGFVVRSVLAPKVIGTGDSETEAFQVFQEILEDYLSDLDQGKVDEPKRRGRPKSNKQEVHLTISENGKNVLAHLTTKHGLTAGEVTELAIVVLAQLEEASTVKIAKKSTHTFL